MTASKRLPLAPPLLLSLAALFGASGCGPTEAEVGATIVVLAPGITILGALIASLYRRAWDAVSEQRLPFSWHPSLLAAGVQTIAASAVLALAQEGGRVDDDHSLLILALFGPSYLSVQLLILRSVARRSQKLFSRLSLAGWAIFYPTALLMAMFGSLTDETSDVSEALFVLPGFGGIATAVIATPLAIELVVRWRKVVEHRRALEPQPLPTARLRAK